MSDDREYEAPPDEVVAYAEATEILRDGVDAAVAELNLTGQPLLVNGWIVIIATETADGEKQLTVVPHDTDDLTTQIGMLGHATQRVFREVR